MANGAVTLSFPTIKDDPTVLSACFRFAFLLHGHEKNLSAFVSSRLHPIIDSMRRSRPVEFCRDAWPASSVDEKEATEQLIQPVIPGNPLLNRLLLLPAYPTFDRFGPVNQDHLLLANVPGRELTREQQRRRSHREFHQPFTLIDQSADVSVRPFFVYIHQQLYEDLNRRCYLDNAILDYNYERLRQCLNTMIQERIRYGLTSETTVGNEQLRIDEYALAMEFYLQIDGQSSLILPTAL